MTNSNMFKVRMLAGVSLAGIALAAPHAVYAATKTVCPSGCTSTTITGGIAAANPLGGDTVKVAAGVYHEQVIINKAVTVEGAGKTKSFIDGTSTPLPLLAPPGQVRITANGNVKFSKFTVRNAGATAGGDRFSIFAAGPSPGGMTYTISDNAIVGSGNALDDKDYGFYTQNAYDTLVFSNNTISQTGSDAIVLERHYGASDVNHNTFDRGVSDGSVDAYFNMNYGGTDITTLQRVRENKINMGSGALFTSDQRGFAITFAGAFASTFPGVDGRFTDVEVEHNEIVNLKPYRRGIGFWNNGTADGGDITGVIADNKITGTAGDVTGTLGVRLLGLINDTFIDHNELKKLATGMQFREWDNGNATDALVTDNSVTEVVLGLEMQAGASGNIASNNKIYASGSWTVTMSGGTSGNDVVFNHLRALAGTVTGNATVLDNGTGNVVNGNTN